MTREEAKLFLQAYRPGGQDAEDPHFAEALALAKRDPELAAWFARQQKFDALFSDGLRQVRAPAQLKAQILAGGPKEKTAAPSISDWWQNLILFRSPVSWAAAAAAVLILFGLAVFLKQPQASAHFADYSAQMVHAAVSDAHHLDVENKDMTQVVAWLAEHHGENKFNLPVALNGASGLMGCRVLDWHGQKISMLCYGLSNTGHVDLFVADAKNFPDAPPEDNPQFASSGGMPTASWSHGGMAYLMVGHNADADLKKLLPPEMASAKAHPYSQSFRL
jgi:anti-sigma factor RsiW